MIFSLDYRKVQIYGFIIVVFLLFQIRDLLAVQHDAPQENGLSGIDFKNGLLKVSVKRQMFYDIMEEVAEKTGVRVLINDPDDEEFTINFDYLPLEAELKKLLWNRNYVFSNSTSQESDRLELVVILSKREGVVGKVSADRTNKEKSTNKTLAQESLGLEQIKRFENKVLLDLVNNGVLTKKKETSVESYGLQDIERALKENIQGMMVQIQQKLPVKEMTTIH